tara:strand:+ start:13371 stop:14078 length:708 start_codon:yes stop_codon:yes gene_type:complete
MSFVSQNHKLCFIHVPKAGGSSISEALKKSVPAVIYSRKRQFGSEYPDPYRWSGSGHHTILDYQQEFKRSPDWSFAIIRNPYERCVSAFMVHSDYGKKYYSQGATDERMLHEWEKYLIFCENWNKSRSKIFRRNNSTLDSSYGFFHSGPAIHMLPSHYMISIEDKIAVNKLVAMRDIHKIPSIVEHHTGIKIFNILHENKSDSKNFYDLFLTNENKRIIERIYGKDFELYERAHE